MNRDFATFRLSQLPLVIFGIIYAVFNKGITLSFFKQSLERQNCAMTLLP